jgi:hypothetical protein
LAVAVGKFRERAAEPRKSLHGTELELPERSLAEAFSYELQQLRRNPRVREQVLTEILDADYRDVGWLQSDHRCRPRGAVDGAQLTKY